jgi:hypothetical protein
VEETNEERKPQSRPGVVRRPKRAAYVTSESFFFNRVIPILLVTLAVITLVLVLVAAGIMLQIIPWH